MQCKVTLKVMCQDKIYILGRVCTTKSLPLSKIESLGISSQYHKWQPDSEASVEDIQWSCQIFSCEGSVPIRGNCTIYRVRAASERSHRLGRKSITNVTFATRNFHGRAPSIGICQHNDREVRRNARPLRSGSLKNPILLGG
jgi:hypothetical protein